jgi:type I restriction enzyme, S subunit
MSQGSQIRTYSPSAAAVFLKTNEKYGGLSNMAPGFPLCVNGVRIRTSEALYQACRFPHLPDIQRQIIDERSPMTAKMRIKPLKKRSRQDWDSVRVKIMRWCLRVKLAQNWRAFGELLLSTGDLPIVEQSRKDDFWGAKVSKDGSLVGMNVLGRLLMELREQLKSGDIEGLKLIEPPPITNFVLYHQPIEAVCAAEASSDMDTGVKKRGIPPMQIKPVQPSLFAQPTRPQVHNSSTDGSPRNGVTIIKGYPEYKDSGQPFLGEIPAHWDLFRNGRLFSQRNETGFGELPILEVSLKTGVRVRDMDNLKRKQVMSDREKYKRAAQGDIAYNMMRMWQGAVGVAPVDGLVSPAYVVVRPFPEVDCRYFSYLFRTVSYMNEVDAYSRGIVKDRNRLYWQDFKRMPSPVPSIEEQRHITRFLDAVGSKAQRFIRNKRQLIELLKEQKQNVINQAVTRGLDPKVQLKPSGVEWIGDIPEHWEVRRLKFLCHNLNEQTSEKQPGETYIALEHVESWTGRISLPDDEITFDSQVKRFQPGDVLFGKLRPYLAKVTRPQTAGVCVGEFLVLRATGNVSADFLEQKLRSKRVIDLINSSTFGAKMPRADWTFIGNLKFAYPPAGEQQKILEHIQEKSAEIDQAITRAQSEIELMREYRTRLISDVVTGQVDVRGIEVPEVAEDELLALEEDTADADDVIDDEGDMDETD